MKYFCISDVHGFYDELIEALNTAGYDKDNVNHFLIVGGDIFDRGPKPKEVYEFLRSLPKDRKVLIKGNHEDMFLELLNKNAPNIYDYSNKLVDTFYSLSEFNMSELRFFSSFESAPWSKVIRKIKSMKIAQWLKSDEWVDYYELGRFIFVHSFIPLQNKQNISIYGHFNYKDYLAYFNDWRTSATDKEWRDSRWGCPWKQYEDGLFKQEEADGKTLVCGHWHTSDFHHHLGHDYHTSRSDIYHSKGIIALDGGVTRDGDGTYKHDCNVLVIENGICYNKYGEELLLDNVDSK